MRRAWIGAIAALILLGAVPVLARPQPSAAGYSEASIAGAWTWTWSGRLIRYPFASIGIATFDGKGECTIALKENSGVNRAYDHNSQSCTYEVSKDGTGTADFSLDGEEGSIAFSVAHKEIAFVSRDAGAVAAGIMRPWTQAGTISPAGKWAFLLDGTIFGERTTGSGVITLKPNGKCSQSLVYNYGTGSQTVKSDSCSYEIDDQGFGFLDVAYDNDTGGDAYFVLADGGRRMSMLTSARGEILLGSALRR